MTSRFLPCALAAAGLLGGCATLAPQGQLNKVTKQFSEVVASGTTAINTEIAAKPAVRRDEALMYYFAHPDDPGNLTRAGVPRSFANYVCAGQGSLSKQTAELEYLKAYGDSLAAVTKPGADTFAGQWKKYKELRATGREPPKPGETPPPPNALFDQCVAEVLPLLQFPGVSATDFTNESPLGFLLGLKSLLDAVEQVGKSALKGVNEVESRRLFTEMVTGQHEEFRLRLGNELNPAMLDNAWQRRKARALWRPYRTFSRMMELDPVSKREEILKMADEVNRQLAEYDALTRTKSPADVVVAIAKAEEALYDVATNKDLSPSDILDFLILLGKDVEQIKEDYEALGEAVRTATSS